MDSCDLRCCPVHQPMISWGVFHDFLFSVVCSGFEKKIQGSSPYSFLFCLHSRVKLILRGDMWHYWLRKLLCLSATSCNTVHFQLQLDCGCRNCLELANICVSCAELAMLQSKFEQDKKRIQQLRAQRKFNPYWCCPNFEGLHRRCSVHSTLVKRSRKRTGCYVTVFLF